MRKTALKINKLLMNRNHSYKQRSKSQINWIVIHYVGALGDAKANCEYYGSTDVGASADFFVGHNGDIWQANDYWNYYSWHCGGGRQSNEGGEYFRKCMNVNSIGIEMCVRKKSTRTMNATDRDWYFEDATIKSTVELVKYLMKELDIDAGHVIRHFSVNGKYCPNPFVFDTGKVKWADFKAMIEDKPIERVDNDASGTQAVEFDGLSEGDAADKILDLIKACDNSGILYSVTAAQMILESGYVTTDLAKNANNCFGMKCELSGNTWPNSTWDGISRYTKKTAEQTAAGKTYYVYADFRKYPSIEDSIKDHAAYLLGAEDSTQRSGLRYNGLLDCKDYKSAITLIKKGGYATDVNYVSKICNIIQRFELDRYDSEVKVVKTTVQKAVEWALKTAKDDTHGYNNTKGKRTGNPDYACSSFIAAAWRAAGLKTIPADAYTATLRKYLLEAGFEDVTADVNLKTGKGMKIGDVVLTPGKHVEMIANGKHQLVGARGNATGGAENGKAGDQTGGEIAVTNWYDFGWRFCLRYKEKVVSRKVEETKEEPKEKGTFVVQAGAFAVKGNAQNRLTQVRKIVPDAFLFYEDGNWKVQAGSFSVKANAEAVVSKLTKAGLPAFIR